MANERVIGRGVTVTCDGVKTEWDTIKISDPSDDFEATAASAERKQYVDGQDGQVVLTITGFLGGETPPDKNSVVDDIDIALAVGSIPITFDDAAYGEWHVKNTSYDMQAGPAKYSFEVRSNYLPLS